MLYRHVWTAAMALLTTAGRRAVGCTDWTA
jgi:hypothetical protein